MRSSYDWRPDVLTLVCFTATDESHDALKRVIAYIERPEAERPACPTCHGTGVKR